MSDITLEQVREELRLSAEKARQQDLSQLYNEMDERKTRPREDREITMERIIGNKWNAVYGPMPETPSPELLEATRLAAAVCCVEASEAMRRNEADANPVWEEGGPDAHEYFEGFWLDARERFDSVSFTTHGVDRGSDEARALFARDVESVVAANQNNPQGPDETPPDGKDAAERLDNLRADIRAEPIDGPDTPLPSTEDLNRMAQDDDTQRRDTLRDGAQMFVQATDAAKVAEYAENPKDGWRERETAEIRLEAAYQRLAAGSLDEAKAAVLEASKDSQISEAGRPAYAVDPSRHAEARAQQGQEQTTRSDPAEIFRSAGRATTHTPQNERERDLAEVITRLAETAGATSEAEYSAFQLNQQMRGENITRETDAFKRQQMRDEREAAGHEYAARLSDRLAIALNLDGQGAEARDMQLHADIRREIAGELRGPETPERAQPETPSQFAETAREASGLGKTAETVFVVDGPGKDQNDIRGRAGQSDYSGLNSDVPDPTRPEPSLTRGVTVGVGPGGAVLQEVIAGRPEPRAAEEELLSRQAAESTARQEGERKELAGEAPTRSAPQNDSAYAEALRQMKEERAGMEKGGEERQQGQEQTSSKAAFRSFGRGP